MGPTIFCRGDLGAGHWILEGSQVRARKAPPWPLPGPHAAGGTWQAGSLLSLHEMEVEEPVCPIFRVASTKKD